MSDDESTETQDSGAQPDPEDSPFPLPPLDPREYGDDGEGWETRDSA